jgi:hypothetical protein
LTPVSYGRLTPRLNVGGFPARRGFTWSPVAPSTKARGKADHRPGRDPFGGQQQALENDLPSATGDVTGDEIHEPIVNRLDETAQQIAAALRDTDADPASP